MPTLYVRNPYRQLTRRHMLDAIDENNIEESKVIFPVDIRISDDEYMVEAFLPGVTTEDLDIQIESNVVTIKGELKIERNEDDRYLLRERPSGMFQRSIELPDDVDADKVEAELKNGVLTLRLPKSELAKPRKIKISNN
jgi:HSP20 family protein